MPEEKKKVDHFPDFNYRFFQITHSESSMEGIQGPVYTPSKEVLDLGDTPVIEIVESAPVFHDGEAKVYDLETKEFDMGISSDEMEVWDPEKKEEKVLGYIPCPKCGDNIPVTSDKRPYSFKCPGCGKKGKLQ
ncbi:MAG: hypothetical protein QCI82_05795 [Candidatus Thermoplasmatota archaeon]|nr:hypothetical protein [Candidatus Thermoplasmatota archaeon]